MTQRAEASDQAVDGGDCRTRAIPFTEIPRNSKLFTDYLYNFDNLAGFYGPLGRGGSELKDWATRIAGQDFQRDEVVAALRDQNHRFGSSPLVFEHLDYLQASDSVAVVTGQQAGLFTGPLYTIMKGLSAARLAHELRKEGVNAVPVFWIASEDHDFAEVNHCKVIDPSDSIATISLDGCPAPAGQPVGLIHLCVEITRLVDQFAAELPESGIRDEVTELLHRAYAPGVGFAEAFARVLARLFGPYGVILLDPLDNRLKAVVAGSFQQALVESNQIDRELIDQSQAVIAAGYHAQVHIEPNAVPLFLLHKGRREALVRKGDDFFLKSNGESVGSVDEMVELAGQKPSAFSPNVTLRPVIQDTLLPTLTYVAGPSELAYFAQLKPLYKRFGRLEPAITPRGSATLIDHSTEKTLRKYNLSIEDLFLSPDALFEKVVSQVLDSGTARVFDEATKTIEAQLDELRAALTTVDVTIAAALDSRRKKIRYHLDNLRRKYIRARTGQDDLARKRLIAAQTAIYPERNLQEREINLFSFVVRHGFEVVDQIYQSLDPGCNEHQLIYLNN